MSDQMNDHMALISGESATGKSAALRNIPNQDMWMYFNCEAGKRLPFKNSFQTYRIVDPYQVMEGMDYAKANPDKVEGIIIDTSTFMMDMLESQYVITATNTQKAWGEYSQFWKRLMQEKAADLDIPILILAHTKKELNEEAGRYDVSVPVKGALKNNGIEAYFSTVISTKRVPLKELEPFNTDANKLLHIEPDDELVGFKHVFQTRLTKATVGERIRSPMGMWSHDETFIDNDAVLLIERLKSFYGD